MAVVEENLDEESSQIKDVYAHYGLAMYLAQCLEHGIVNALLYTKLIPQEKSRAGVTRGFNSVDFEKRFDIFMDEQFELTLGWSHQPTATKLSTSSCLRSLKMPEIFSITSRRK